MAEARSITIAMAQMNPIVGDLAGNAARIQMFYEKAARMEDVDLVVFPELALIGYPPEDLVLMSGFRDRALLALQELAGKTMHGPAMIVGTVWEDRGQITNAAVLLDEGRISFVQHKTILPNYGVFDEKRVFSAANGANLFEWRGLKLAVLICEDVWSAEVVAPLAKLSPDICVVINASPFEADKLAQRKGVVSSAVARLKAPLVYVNMVGGQDDLVFDGGSFAANADGTIVAQAREFSEALEVVRLSKALKGWQFDAGTVAKPLAFEETLWQAMALGLHDYVGKNGFSGVVLGLSGGIDSALTLSLAVDALGCCCHRLTRPKKVWMMRWRLQGYWALRQ